MADMVDDPDCFYVVSFSPASVQRVKEMFDPKRVLERGCRVIKHPNCCVLCAVNDDCRRLPMHFHCRCRPQFYFMIDIITA